MAKLPAKTTPGVKKWTLRNEQIIIMRMAGATQEEIGKAFGISRKAVERIEKHPQAAIVEEEMRAALRERLLDDIESQLDQATRDSMKAIMVTVGAEMSAFHPAKSNQDRVALKVLEGRGYLGKEKNDEGSVTLSSEQFSVLIEQMKKSDAAQQIDPFADRPVDPDVVEVDYEIVSS